MVIVTISCLDSHWQQCLLHPICKHRVPGTIQLYPWGVLVLLIFLPIHGASIAFLIPLKWKCENLLGEKQPKFTETRTPLEGSETNSCVPQVGLGRFVEHFRKSLFLLCIFYIFTFLHFTLYKTFDVNDNYRPQTKFAKVMFSHAPVCPQGVPAWQEGCMCGGGGVAWQGGHAWQGVCMAGGAYMVGEHMW